MPIKGAEDLCNLVEFYICTSNDVRLQSFVAFSLMVRINDGRTFADISTQFVEYMKIAIPGL